MVASDVPVEDSGGAVVAASVELLVVESVDPGYVVASEDPEGVVVSYEPVVVGSEEPPVVGSDEPPVVGSEELGVVDSDGDVVGSDDGSPGYVLDSGCWPGVLDSGGWAPPLQSRGGYTESAWLQVSRAGSQMVPAGQSKKKTENLCPLSPSQSTQR